MTIKLEGRAAIITGAGRGIGRALAEKALDAGMIVHAWDRDPIDTTGLPDRFRPRMIDVRDAAAVADAAKAVFDDGVPVTIVCANAGILRAGRAWEVSPEDWRQVMEINILGVAAMITACVPRMIGQSERSHILLTASQSSFVARPGNTVYSSSKHAVWGIAESLRIELDEAKAPVGVSMLAPGPVRTDLVKGMGGAFETALRDIGMPPENVATACFDAIAADRFWVITHDDFKPLMQQRIDRLMAGQNPA